MECLTGTIIGIAIFVIGIPILFFTTLGIVATVRVIREGQEEDV